MFIGHFGVGFAAKKIENKPSLGTLFLAAQFVDLLWPLLLLLGFEKVKVVPSASPFTVLDFVYYPFSHSLLSGLIWALVFGGFYFLIRKDFRSSVVLAVLVISHWILDLIVHVPDLPLVPWSNYKVGFGLWNSVPLTIIVEGAIFIIGVGLYISATKAKNKKGVIGLWALVIFLVIVYIMNLVSPPPPDEKAIGYVGFAQWIIIIWGYWINRNRSNISKSPLVIPDVI